MKSQENINLIPPEITFSYLSQKSIPEDEASYFITLTYVIRMAEICYSRLFEILSNREVEIYAAEPFMYAWGLIDHFDRLKKLTNKPVALKKKSPWYQVFYREFNDENLKNLRDSIQHIDERIKIIIENRKPLIGVLCYWEKLSEVAHTPRLFHTSIGKAQVKMHHPDPQKGMRARIDYINLYFAEEKVELSNLFYKAQRFVVDLDEYLKKKYQEK